MRRTVLAVKCNAIERRPAELWGQRWNACDIGRTFCGVRTVRGRPGGFLLTMDALVLNYVTQFNIVWRVGTFPFLPLSKYRRKTRSVTEAESLFLKNMSAAKARSSSDQRCMSTEGFKPLYPAMCVSPRIYKDVGMALNLIRLIVSAPPCSSSSSSSYYCCSCCSSCFFFVL